MRNKKKWIGVFAVIVCVLAIYPCFRFMSRKESYVMKQDAYQYVNGTKITYAKETKLEKDKKDRIVRAKTGEELSNLPVYFEENEKLVLPASYAVVFPGSTVKMNKLNYFTEIYRKDTMYFANTGEKEKRLENCFLFDGENTYIFLEEVTLSIGKEQVRLSPLSYVKIVDGNRVQCYVKDGDQTVMKDYGNEVVEVAQGQYSLILNTDELTAGGKQTLLFTNVGKLKNLE